MIIVNKERCLSAVKNDSTVTYSGQWTPHKDRVTHMQPSVSWSSASCSSQKLFLSVASDRKEFPARSCRRTADGSGWSGLFRSPHDPELLRSTHTHTHAAAIITAWTVTAAPLWVLMLICFMTDRLTTPSVETGEQDATILHDTCVTELKAFENCYISFKLLCWEFVNFTSKTCFYWHECFLLKRLVVCCVRPVCCSQCRLASLRRSCVFIIYHESWNLWCMLLQCYPSCFYCL